MTPRPVVSGGRGARRLQASMRRLRGAPRCRRRQQAAAWGRRREGERAGASRRVASPSRVKAAGRLRKEVESGRTRARGTLPLPATTVKAAKEAPGAAVTPAKERADIGDDDGDPGATQGRREDRRERPGDLRRREAGRDDAWRWALRDTCDERDDERRLHLEDDPPRRGLVGRWGGGHAQRDRLARGVSCGGLGPAPFGREGHAGPDEVGQRWRTPAARTPARAEGASRRAVERPRTLRGSREGAWPTGTGERGGPSRGHCRLRGRRGQASAPSASGGQLGSASRARRRERTAHSDTEAPSQSELLSDAIRLSSEGMPGLHL